MPVTADSYEAKAIEIAANMLAASTSFRTATGAASASAAKAFMVESHSGAEVDSETGIGTALDGSPILLVGAPYAVLGLDPGLDVEAGAVGYPDFSVSVVIRLIMALAATGQTPAECTRAAWNLAGAVRAEMQAQVGGGTAFADAEVSSAGLAIGEDGVHRNHIVAQLTITARG